MLRNFKRAEYAAGADEHFALAFEHYTHFTSPIRRYPDLVVHRALQAGLRGAPPPCPDEELSAIARHCSATEREAGEAEAESIEIKRIDYFHRLLWEGGDRVFPAVITRIVPKGLVLELTESLQKGMVPFHRMADDDYRASDNGARAVGQRRRRVWKLGDVVSVRLDRVDTARRRIDFALAEAGEGRAGGGRPGRGKKTRRRRPPRPRG
jgi:ribonuclease R